MTLGLPPLCTLYLVPPADLSPSPAPPSPPQAQGSPGFPLVYASPLHAMATIARTEGVGAFYRGIATTCLKTAPSMVGAGAGGTQGRRLWPCNAESPVHQARPPLQPPAALTRGGGRGCRKGGLIMLQAHHQARPPPLWLAPSPSPCTQPEPQPHLVLPTYRAAYTSCTTCWCALWEWAA